MTRQKSVRYGRLYSRRSESPSSIGLLALSLMSIAAGCGSSADPTPSASVGVARAAVEGADCGYSVTANVHGVGKKAFHAKVEVTNVSGAVSSAFSVLIQAGSAQLVNVSHGSFEVVEGGYLLRPLDSLASSQLDQGQSYKFELKFDGTYTEIRPTILSNNNVSCDQATPTVNLTASGDLFTSNGSLSLRADASDNVAVAKVVFLQDGNQVAVDTSAPYTCDVPITSALNGRHRYEAVAYDLTGNKASQTKRVLVAIGNKFFGTAATTAADYPSLLAHFDQITPGNAGKWGSVESTRNQMNWTELDTAYNFAKTHHLPFKLHTLVWGSQQPAWISTLSAQEQLAEIDEWMSALAARYPDVEMIDVVNEPLHAPPSYAAALGGAGATGWDWVIKAFEMARVHFPNAELLLNDYAILTMASSTQSYLNVIKLLQDRGLIDGIGEQGHFYERAPEMSALTANLASLTATGLPIYISELDLNFADDARQANRMKDVFTAFWSNPSVLGITHWGYLQNNMWQTNAYLVRANGSSRPALTWIECYRGGGTNCTVPPIVPQPRTGDLSGITLEAEEYDSAHALLPAGTMVAYAGNGSWFSFDNVAFNDNWNTLSVTYAQGGPNTINVSLHLDSLDTAPVATVPLAPTGGWTTMKTVSIPWAPIGAQKNVFVRFNGGGANLDKIQFAAPSGTGRNIISDSDFELGTKDGWWSWTTGTIANTTARALTGTHALAMTGRASGSVLVNTLTNSVVPGKTYKASIWASVGAVPEGTTASGFVTTAIQCTGGSTTYGRLGGWGNAKTMTDGSWVELAGDLVIPDCKLANVGIWLDGPGANVDMYIDHVSVRQQTSSNIITNGTFESGTTGWYTWGTGTVAPSTARAHGGTQSLMVGHRTDGNWPAVTDITSIVKAGNKYPFSMWVSIDSADGSSKSINVTQAATCKAADGTTSTAYSWIGGPVTLADAATWTQFSGTVTVPDCNLTQLQFWVEGGVGADLYVDDVEITDNGASSNLIADGTFESGQGAWGGWGYSSLSVVSTAAHSGSQSLLGASMTQYAALARDIKSLVSPGKRYLATAWVSVNQAAGSGAVKWQTVQSCNSVGTDSYPWLAGDQVTNGTWKQLSGTVDLSGCTSIEKLQLFAGADSGDLYLDDVTLTQVP